MADPFASLNRACISAFGSSVIYRQGTGDSFTIHGVLMKDSDEERHGDALYARLFVSLADFQSPPDHGDVATIDGMTYTVYEVLLDAVSGAHLRLRAVA
jgi:hypothetical protein